MYQRALQGEMSLKQYLSGRNQLLCSQIFPSAVLEALLSYPRTVSSDGFGGTGPAGIINKFSWDVAFTTSSNPSLPISQVETPLSFPSPKSV